ncbi:MAG: hypothetical protein ACE5GZ_00745 [Gammaproteobacteria bacterium]
MTDQLHQINVSYVPVEDRLLLRVSTKKGDEYRLWLTRRFTEMLINVLNREIDKKGGMSSIASSQETTKMFKEGAFDKSYEADNIDYPLGETGILAYRIKAGNTENGNLRLELSPGTGKGMTLSLNRSLLYMFHNLLSQGIEQTGWRLISEENASMKTH